MDWLGLENEDWKPTYRELSGQRKAEVRAALLQEQGWVCCYCERRITGQNDCHIEHAIPQSVDESRALDYSNLRASCQGDQPTAPGHCGHQRGDATLPVHPGMPDCTDWFVFEDNGAVAPSPHRDHEGPARTTIGILALDIPKLRLSREAAISGVIETLAASGVPVQASGYEARGADGRFMPHGSAIAQFLRRLALPGLPPATSP